MPGLRSYRATRHEPAPPMKKPPLLPTFALSLLLAPSLSLHAQEPAPPPTAPPRPAPAAANTNIVELLQASILKRYPGADLDKDGRINQEELRALTGELRKQGKGMTALAPEPTMPDAKYGPHERNVMDFWKADTSGPAPVLVHIHGGGFVAGNKESIGPEAIFYCLANGVSFASINYRYTTQAIYPAPMEDGARAIQFLRSKAKEWNIDPARIGAFGGSAGAGISMWIGFHDDLAKADSSDPILRESSRLKCIGTMGGQSTYDPLVIEKWVGLPAAKHPALFKFYGVETYEDFSRPEVRKMADDAAAMTHVSKDDPPIFMVYGEADAPLPPSSPPGAGIHHPIFGHKLKERMDALGIECIYRHQDDKQSPPPALAMAEWLVKKLKE